MRAVRHGNQAVVVVMDLRSAWYLEKILREHETKYRDVDDVRKLCLSALRDVLEREELLP